MARVVKKNNGKNKQLKTVKQNNAKFGGKKNKFQKKQFNKNNSKNSSFVSNQSGSNKGKKGKVQFAPNTSTDSKKTPQKSVQKQQKTPQTSKSSVSQRKATPFPKGGKAKIVEEVESGSDELSQSDVSFPESEEQSEGFEESEEDSMDVSEEEEVPPVQPPKKQKSQPQKIEKMKVASPVSKQASQTVKKPEMGEKGTKRKRDEEAVPMSAEEFTIQNDQKRLFVTNLPGNVSEDEIKALDKNIVDFVILAAYRKRKCSVILVFPSEAVVERVLPLLKGKDVRGNKLVADYVGHKNSKRNPQDMGPIVDNRLYVGNLGEHCNEASLKAIFTTATKISVPVKRRHNFGFVEFADFPTALEALKKHNYSVFKGEKMIVQFARAKTEESSKSKEDSSSKRVKVEESESEGIDEESGEDIGDSEDDVSEVDDESDGGDDLESFDEEEED